MQFGELERALEDLVAAIREGSANYYGRYQTRLLAAKVGERDAYRQLCPDMAETLEASQDAHELHFSAWTAALAPAALDDYGPAILLARRSLEADPHDPQCRGGLGSILYRAGQFEEALEHLQAAADADASEKTSTAYAAQ